MHDEEKEITNDKSKDNSLLESEPAKHEAAVYDVSQPPSVTNLSSIVNPLDRIMNTYSTKQLLFLLPAIMTKYDEKEF